MSNSLKRVQAPTIYSIYILFFITRSGDFVGTPPQVLNIRGGGARDLQCIWFQTYSHTDLKFYDEIFYPIHEYKGYRRRAKPGVPKDIHKILTPRALAYWFMDDGSYRTIKAKRYYVFSTQSFILEDQSRLVQALINRLRRQATIQKFEVYIRKPCLHPLSVNLIRPYIHPCFD